MSELSLEEQSFNNLVHFYSEMLRLVLNGTTTTELFSYSERKKLVKSGILIMKYTHGGPKYFLSPEAESLL